MVNGPIQTKLAKIFDDAQRTAASHSKCSRRLLRLYEQDEEAFKDAFVPLLKHVLVVPNKEPSVDRVLSFIVKVITRHQKKDDGDEGAHSSIQLELCNFTITHILKYIRSSKKIIRLRSCQVIARTLNGMPGEAEIDSSIWDTLLKKMLPRLRDKFPIIRLEAVKCLARLQDPNDAEDKVLQEYLKLMATDSNKDVRKCVVKNLGFSAITIGPILKRAKDIAPDVRKCTYKLVGVMVPAKKLNIDHRISLLRNGLNDSKSEVVKACADMLCNGWLKSTNGDPLKLLKLLLVEKFESICEQAIKIILKNVDMAWNPKENGVADKLTPEGALFWRVYLWKLHKDRKEDPKINGVLEVIAPTIPVFCSLLKTQMPPYAKKGNMFILKQLVQMIRYLDLQDEAGRRELSALLRNSLPSSRIDGHIKKFIMKALRQLHANEDDYIHSVLEIVSEIQDPLESSQRVPFGGIDEVEDEEDGDSWLSYSMEDKIHDLNSLKTALEKKKDLQGLERINREIEILKMRGEYKHDDEPTPNSFETEGDNKDDEGEGEGEEEEEEEDEDNEDEGEEELEENEERKEKESQQSDNMDEELKKLTPDELRSLHSMSMTEELLEHTNKKLNNAGIHGLLRNVILRHISHTNPLIRERAIHCLGLFCMLDKTVAQTYLELFLKVAENDLERIQCNALKVLFDLLLVYGMPDPEKDKSATTPSKPSLTLAPSSPSETENTATAGLQEVMLADVEAAVKFSDLVGSLTHFLFHDDDALRTIAVEGFCKLLYGELVNDIEIFGRLVVLFFLAAPEHGGDEEEHNVREHIRERKIVAKVKVVDVAKMLLYLTDLPEDKRDEITSGAHNRLAVQLVKEILSDTEDVDNILLCRVLKDLKLIAHPTSILILRILTEDLEKATENANPLLQRSVVSFKEHLKELAGNTELQASKAETERAHHDLAKHIKAHKAFVLSKPKKPTHTRVMRTVRQPVVYTDEEEPETPSKRRQSLRRSKTEAESRLKAYQERKPKTDGKESESSGSSSSESERSNEADDYVENRSRGASRLANGKPSPVKTGSINKNTENDVPGKNPVLSDDEEITDLTKDQPKTPEKTDENSNDAKSPLQKNGEDDVSITTPNPIIQSKTPKKSTPSLTPSRTNQPNSPTPPNPPQPTQPPPTSPESPSPSPQSDFFSPQPTNSHENSAKKPPPPSPLPTSSPQQNQDNTPIKNSSKPPADTYSGKSPYDVVVVIESFDSDEERAKISSQSQSQSQSQEYYNSDGVSSSDSDDEDKTPRRKKRKPNNDDDYNYEKGKKRKHKESVERSTTPKKRKVKTPVLPQTPWSKVKNAVIMFDEGFNVSRLSGVVLSKLNVTIATGSNFVSSITHVIEADMPSMKALAIVTSRWVVSPQSLLDSSTERVATVVFGIEGDKPSMKVLAAIVTSRWVVSPQWLLDSTTEGRLLNESRYGTKCNNPIYGKTFYFDESFLADDPRRQKTAVSIIQTLGKGILVEDPTQADFVIVGTDKEIYASYFDDENVPHTYTWDEFVIWLLDQRFLIT